jgi:hypothetical protein
MKELHKDGNSPLGRADRAFASIKVFGFGKDSIPASRGNERRVPLDGNLPIAIVSRSSFLLK